MKFTTDVLQSFFILNLIFSFFWLRLAKRFQISPKNHDNLHKITVAIIFHSESVETSCKFIFSVVLHKTIVERDLCGSINRNNVKITGKCSTCIINVVCKCLLHM